MLKIRNAMGFLSGVGAASLISKYSSVCDFEAVDIHGNNQQLSKYKGYVTLVVNVASE